MTESVAQRGEAFAQDPPEGPAVRGFLHRPQKSNGDGWVVTHGAGGNCGSGLLVSLAASFAEAGVCVLRCDLPFRQARPQGPPWPAGAAKDREGLRTAVTALRRVVRGRVFLGGQSYGGRQATMLSAEDRGVADGLVLLSYPLHPPQAPAKKRTEHFPQLHVPALFIHGTDDPFGTPGEMEETLKLIPAATKLVFVEGGGHGLASAKGSRAGEVVARILAEFQSFFGGQ
jgi:predicted alpha/beta-hydrolase family hydrolase